MKNVAYVAAIAVAIAAVACGSGTPTSPSQAPSALSTSTINRTVDGGGLVSGVRTASLSSSDNTLASVEASANYNLIQLGMLAEQRADRLEVKMFGRQLNQEFSEALDQLSDLAEQEVVRDNARFDATDQATYSTLSRLSGSEFDRAFVSAIIAELTSTRTAFQANMAAASSSDLRAHASALDSMASRFLTHARDLETYL